VNSHPFGPIAAAEHHLMATAALLMLIVVIPVFVMAIIFPRIFRVANSSARYRPDWSSSRTIEALIWLVPTVLVAVIGHMVWTQTHRLDPYRPLPSNRRPMEVDVIAQDWKWLFLYPEQGIATVNELVFPSDRPLHLKLTSDASMNSLLIPDLAGQIYVMAGMQTELNLAAPADGDFVGRNTQFNGTGFDDEHFVVQAIGSERFDAWIAGIKRASRPLDAAVYAELTKPSSAVPVSHYSSFDGELFDLVMHKYMLAPAKHAQPAVSSTAPALKD
jgi:cytochrome o ubiquinol oxidase subunit II